MFAAAALFLALLPAPAGAGLGIPMVDISSHLPSAQPMIAVWSRTDAYVVSNTTMTIGFPSGWTPTASLNIAGCACIFLKHTISGTAGTFTPSEITVTAGIVTASAISVSLPAHLAPGPFYLRIDDFAAIPNPTTGTATLTLGYGNQLIESKPVFFSYNLQPAPAELVGRVTDGGVVVKGAVIIVSTDTTLMDSAPDLTLGPAAGTVTAKPVTLQRLMTVTGVDGRYSLKLPFNGTTTYNVSAIYGTSAQGSALNKKSATQTVSVSAASTYTINMTTFSNTATN
jgi:hypothetical protein